MCSRDPLFYINTFVWTFDPRREPARIPLISYEFQDEAIVRILCSIRKPNDLVIPKSRDMTATWDVLSAFEWLWHFRELQAFLCVSRKEDLVDKSDDPDSLMWKIDFILENLPVFLKPQVTRMKLHLKNQETGSTIDGSSTTGDVARGGRRTAIFFDEFASVENGREVLAASADATQSRLFVSTPKGTGNAFYDLVQSDIDQLRLHWTLHPEKAKGLYYDDEGKPRSPWYDAEYKRRQSKLEMAQEVDMDFLASGSQFFETGVLDQIQRDDVRPPYDKGDLIFDTKNGQPREFVQNKQRGKLDLWINIDATRKPPRDRRFALGVDVSAGSDASNSVITVGDVKTGEKVAEFVTTNVLPHDLALHAMAIGKWFQGQDDEAFMIWEDNGPGQIFGRTLIDTGYRHIYYRRDEARLSRRVSDKPGWHTTREGKQTILGDLRRALAGRQFINRSLEAIKEAREYIYEGDTVVYARSSNQEDPSGARSNHGDRVMADALCWKGMREQATVQEEELPKPEHCFWARRERRKQKQRMRAAW